MKFLLPILLLCDFAFGVPAQNPLFAYRQPFATTNLAATYPTSPQFVGPANRFVQISVDNDSASEIEVNCSETTQPSIGMSDSFQLPAYTTVTVTTSGVYSLVNVCWFRSFTGTLSTGFVYAVGQGY